MSLTENEVRYQNAALADENARLRAALEKIAQSNTAYGIIAANALGQSLPLDEQIEIVPRL